MQRQEQTNRNAEWRREAHTETAAAKPSAKMLHEHVANERYGETVTIIKLHNAKRQPSSVKAQRAREQNKKRSTASRPRSEGNTHL
jgi:hypothetical protein